MLPCVQKTLTLVMTANPVMRCTILFYSRAVTKGKVWAQKASHKGTRGMMVWPSSDSHTVMYKVTSDTQWFLPPLHHFEKEDSVLHSCPQLSYSSSMSTTALSMPANVFSLHISCFFQLTAALRSHALPATSLLGFVHYGILIPSKDSLVLWLYN